MPWLPANTPSAPWMRYDSEVNYLQVLLARQELLEARLSLLSRHYGFLDSTIQLYKALGGDVMH